MIMKRIFFLLVFALISVAGFSQDYFEGITGLKFLNTDSLVVDQDFIWKGDTIKKDSLVYVDIRTDSVGFRYINGQFKWIKNYSSQIAKFTIHIANDEDTVKTNELISELEFTDDTLKISEAGIVHKVRINSSSGNTIQTLSGTSPTYDITAGIHANITLTGNTIITLSNLTAGDTGNLTVINAATTYTLDFAGYTNKISANVYSTTNRVLTSGGSKIDVYSWYYNGVYLEWNGTLDLK